MNRTHDNAKRKTSVNNALTAKFVASSPQKLCGVVDVGAQVASFRRKSIFRFSINQISKDKMNSSVLHFLFFFVFAFVFLFVW